MSVLIIFGIILGIAWALDEQGRRNKELQMAEEFAKKGYTQEYKIENHYHSDWNMDLNETFDIKGMKTVEAEVVKEEGVSR